jgi:hypothetical protein|tara:strand:+ start:2181 stop:2348 length:168 start_codon:yes stop_codon:yes gene_type:complete
MKTKDNKAFTIPIIETNLDYAKRIMQEISNELWNIPMCKEFAQDLDKALEIIERK